MRVLYVCTANICRSPSAAALLMDADVPGVEVRSAGTAASAGAAGCPIAPALARRSEYHRSQALNQELVAWADLVLTAAREHQAVVRRLDPKARTRTFTIRQAGRLAGWLLDAGMVSAGRMWQADPDQCREQFAEGDPRLHVVPLPERGDQRAAWLVAELDAARGMAPAAQPPPDRSGGWRRRAPDELPHPDDVPDPHVLGAGWHVPAAEQIAEATAALAAVLRETAG